MRARPLLWLPLVALLSAHAGLGLGRHPTRPISEQAAPTMSVESVVRDLATIWAIDFAPDGRIFLTERSGRIRTVRDGVLDPEPWMTLDVVETRRVRADGPRAGQGFRDQRLRLRHLHLRRRGRRPPESAGPPQGGPRDRARRDGHRPAGRRARRPGPRRRPGQDRAGRQAVLDDGRERQPGPGAEPGHVQRQDPAPQPGRLRSRPTTRSPARRSTRTATATRRGSPGSRAPACSSRPSTARAGSSRAATR